jgi:hypothetical protein
MRQKKRHARQFLIYEKAGGFQAGASDQDSQEHVYAVDILHNVFLCSDVVRAMGHTMRFTSEEFNMYATVR